ncbi:hypothetical protein DFH07DRAFT_783702 [Mycena maculata]|uniref:Uncharacterized protein n=1 Tax=Mycena maculata TaxID=230809 RepID=A0AAD7MLB0_9AGAR|nr:hypothetical protein DFH07DRAFT_783702 [Mycena maculata]
MGAGEQHAGKGRPRHSLDNKKWWLILKSPGGCKAGSGGTVLGEVVDETHTDKAEWNGIGNAWQGGWGFHRELRAEEYLNNAKRQQRPPRGPKTREDRLMDAPKNGPKIQSNHAKGQAFIRQASQRSSASTGRFEPFQGQFGWSNRLSAIEAARKAAEAGEAERKKREAMRPQNNKCKQVSPHLGWRIVLVHGPAQGGLRVSGGCAKVLVAQSMHKRGIHPAETLSRIHTPARWDSHEDKQDPENQEKTIQGHEED